jgi:hypothetical protein
LNQATNIINFLTCHKDHAFRRNDELPANNDTNEETEVDHSLAQKNSILVILTLLIGVSLLFELGRDKIEEKSEKEMKPILNSLWKGNCKYQPV